MITKSELIEYLKHTPENTNYNILRSGLYNGSNKEIVDEFIEVLSNGNLSLAALQPYLAKLYEDDKTISPEPLPPLSINAHSDWNQNDPDGDGYVKNRPGGYMTDPVITDVDTFTITSAEDQGGVYFAVVAVESSAITLSDYTIGDGVIVDFGGQSYSLTWQSMEGFPACGAAVTGEAPDWSAAPFCIIAVFGGKGSLEGYYVYLQNAVTSPIQVKLTMAKQTPVKIPEKYLELDSAKEIMQFTISYNQHTGKYESDRTYDELKAALDAGKTVFAKFRNVMGEFYTYGLLYQRHMYVPGIWVYVGGSDPCEWQCAEGNKWTKRQLLRLSTGIGEPKKAGTAAYGTSEYASRDDHVHPSELPDVSADDDGKLLGVTGGTWGKVDKPSGGASEFVVNGTIGGETGVGYSITLDKTADQILAAINEGKSVIARVALEITIDLPLVSFDTISGNIIFAGVVDYMAMDSISPIIYFLRLRSDEATLYSSVAIGLDPEGKLPQVSMASAPTRDMHIATKKYVDDKEFILQSTTPNSTKKFKITVDDTGTLSAAEVT